MARGDGIHRTNARNMRLTAARIGNAQQHNEREKGSYVNQDIVPERTRLNIHFKKPTAGYAEMFEQMKEDGIISTRGLKEDAFLYGELVFDVNTAYFHNHGGYDFAKQCHLLHLRRQADFLHRPPSPGPSGADPTGGPRGKEPRIIPGRAHAGISRGQKPPPRYKERCQGPLPAPTNTP